MYTKLVAPDSEKDITRHWTYIDKTYISIVCATFNQVSYIRDAINGFLAQRCEYKFEIIIHDDASNDGTTQIIKEYKNKYPSLIRLIIQEENQYSKGRFKPSIYASSYAEGEYIALCEGDDYWLDHSKLQRQISELRKRPEIEMSFHPAYQLINDNVGKILSNYSKNKRIYDVSNVIRGDGGYSPTASLVISRRAVQNLPDFVCENAPVGDLYMQIFSSIKGGALYLPNCMSIYRVNALGSWSSNIQAFERMEQLLERTICSLEKLDLHLDFKHNKDINYLKSKSYYKFAIYCLRNNHMKDFVDATNKAYELKPHFYRVKLLYFCKKSSLLLKIIKAIK